MSIDPILGIKKKLYHVMGCEIYEGFHKSIAAEIMEHKLYDHDGFFQYIIPDYCPRLLAVYRKNNKIVSYTLLFRDSSHYRYTADYMIGLWTKPGERKQGYARLTSDAIALVLRNKLEIFETEIDFKIWFSPPHKYLPVYHKIFNNMPRKVNILYSQRN